MKTDPVLADRNRFPGANGVILTMVACLFSTTAFADFKGTDPFRAANSNWHYSPYDGGTYVVQNSRLEFLVDSPATGNTAMLLWKANAGGYNQNWFIQVDAYLEILPFSDDGDGIDLSLAVTPSAVNGFRLFNISMNRNRNGGIAGAGIAVVDTVSFLQVQKTSARFATLRLHYDKISRTITPSWKTSSGWNYAAPRNLQAWGMTSAETFQAVLVARNSAVDPQKAKIASGQAYFDNFKTGSAAPDIVVEKSPTSELKDNKEKVLFGTAKQRGGRIAKSFTIRNHGTAVLKGLKLRADGPQAGDFTISEPASVSLLPGDATTFKVSFRPKATGVRKATVHLASNDPDESSFEIHLSGLGVK